MSSNAPAAPTRHTRELSSPEHVIWLSKFAEALIAQEFSFDHLHILVVLHFFMTVTSRRIQNLISILSSSTTGFGCCRQKLLSAHTQYNHTDGGSALNQKVTCSFCYANIVQRHMARHMRARHGMTTGQSDTQVGAVMQSFCHDRKIGRAHV